MPHYIDERIWSDYDTFYGQPNEAGQWDPEGALAAHNPTMVSASSYGTTGPIPVWDGNPSKIDLYTDEIAIWAPHARIPKDKQAHALMSRLPKGPQQRLKQELKDERMCASNWRSAVSLQEHIYWRTKHEYEPRFKLYNENKEKMALLRDHYATICKAEAGGTGPVAEVVVEMRMKIALGEHYYEKPTVPSVSDTQEIAEGNHNVFGKGVDSVEYGIKMTSGVDYLIEMITKTQFVKPIHKYLLRLRRFLGVRRSACGNDVARFINTFYTRKHELLNDKTFDLQIPDSLLAMLMLSYADLTETEYMILMGKIDGDDALTSITETRMEELLRGILSKQVRGEPPARAYQAHEYEDDWDFPDRQGTEDAKEADDDEGGAGA